VVLVAAAPPMPDEPAEPPLHLPEAPVVVLADPVEPVEGAPLVESATVTAPAPIPEAVIGEASAPRSRMLAAVLPEAPPSDEAVRSKDEPDATPAAQTRKYRVRRGDTLVKIMRRQWKTDDPKALNLLLAANPRVAKRRDRIYAGEVLNIPLLEASQLTKVAGRRDRARAAGGRAPVRLYTIRKRDSLVSIARRFLHDAGRWREIAELNRMRDADLILPGTRIKLPGTVTQDT
jgi:nucleoid-associated protein YgaU